MTEQEIKENNELIALFMGAIYSDLAEAWGFENARIEGKDVKIQGKIYKNLVWAERWEKELKYHSDWNWLMPVCIKLGMEFVNTDIVLTYNSVINGIRNLGRN